MTSQDQQGTKQAKTVHSPNNLFPILTEQNAERKAVKISNPPFRETEQNLPPRTKFLPNVGSVKLLCALIPTFSCCWKETNDHFFGASVQGHGDFVKCPLSVRESLFYLRGNDSSVCFPSFCFNVWTIMRRCGLDDNESECSPFSARFVLQRPLSTTVIQSWMLQTPKFDKYTRQPFRTTANWVAHLWWVGSCFLFLGALSAIKREMIVHHRNLRASQTDRFVQTTVEIIHKQLRKVLKTDPVLNYAVLSAWNRSQARKLCCGSDSSSSTIRLKFRCDLLNNNLLAWVVPSQGSASVQTHVSSDIFKSHCNVHCWPKNRKPNPWGARSVSCSVQTFGFGFDVLLQPPYVLPSCQTKILKISRIFKQKTTRPENAWRPVFWLHWFSTQSAQSQVPGRLCAALGTTNLTCLKGSASWLLPLRASNKLNDLVVRAVHCENLDPWTEHSKPVERKKSSTTFFSCFLGWKQLWSKSNSESDQFEVTGQKHHPWIDLRTEQSWQSWDGTHAFAMHPPTPLWNSGTMVYSENVLVFRAHRCGFLFHLLEGSVPSDQRVARTPLIFFHDEEFRGRFPPTAMNKGTSQKHSKIFRYLTWRWMLCERSWKNFSVMVSCYLFRAIRIQPVPYTLNTSQPRGQFWRSQDKSMQLDNTIKYFQPTFVRACFSASNSSSSSSIRACKWKRMPKRSIKCFIRRYICPAPWYFWQELEPCSILNFCSAHTTVIDPCNTQCWTSRPFFSEEERIARSTKSKHSPCLNTALVWWSSWQWIWPSINEHRGFFRHTSNRDLNWPTLNCFSFVIVPFPMRWDVHCQEFPAGLLWEVSSPKKFRPRRVRMSESLTRRRGKVQKESWCHCSQQETSGQLNFRIPFWFAFIVIMPHVVHLCMFLQVLPTPKDVQPRKKGATARPAIKTPTWHVTAPWRSKEHAKNC